MPAPTPSIVSTRIVIDTATHVRLVTMGEADIRRVVSSTTTDMIGLGRFVPVDTLEDGDPAPATDWFTAHPEGYDNAIRVLPVLLDRITYALDPINQGAMRAIVRVMEDAQAEIGPDGTPEPRELSDDALLVLWADAGGDTTDVLWPDRPNTPRPPNPNG